MAPAVPRPSPPGSARRESCTLPHATASVPTARRFVRQVLARWDREAYEEAGTLLVSELVSNVVLHARTECVVEVVELEEGVLLSVADGSPALPVLRRHTREAGTGRGLWLLDQYSSSHGVDVAESAAGKQVWCVLRPEEAEDADSADGALAMWLDAVDAL